MKKGRTVTVPSINYSFVPNHQETMQALAKTPLTGRQLRLIILIMNQTDGYLREEDHLGPKFLEERTGIAEENCYHVLAGLKARGIVASPRPGIFKVTPPRLWRLTGKQALTRKRATVADDSGAGGGITVADDSPPLLPMTVAGVADDSEMNGPKDNL